MASQGQTLVSSPEEGKESAHRWGALELECGAERGVECGPEGTGCCVVSEPREDVRVLSTDRRPAEGDRAHEGWGVRLGGGRPSPGSRV